MKLRIELDIGDALAHRIEFALDLEPALVAGTQPGGEVVVGAALRTELALALQLQRQRVLQTGLRGGIGQPGKLVPGALLLQRDAGGLLLGGFDRARQLCLSRRQAALRVAGFLRLPLQLALLLAAPGQTALGGDHALVELGVALLLVGQLHVEFFEPRLGRDPAFLQSLQQGLDFRQVCGDLLATVAGLLGQLRQPQGFDLQFVRPRPGLRRVAPR